MVRFYGAGVFDLPGWALDILYKCITPLRAEEATWQTNAARTAVWMDREAYQKQMHQWHSMASPIEENAGIITVNPAAEKWFIENSIPYRLAADSAEQ